MHLHDVFNESDSKLSFDWKILKNTGLKYIYIYLPNKLKVKHILRPRFNNYDVSNAILVTAFKKETKL